jgi:hypothetical protein
MANVLQHISVLAIKINGKALPPSYIQRITELSVDGKESHALEIAWKLAFVEGQGQLGLDDPFCKEKDEVELVFGWLGRLSPKHTGTIFAIDGPQLSATGTVLIIKMRDHSTKLTGKQLLKKVAGTAADIVIGTAVGFGLTAYLPTSAGVLRAVHRPGTGDYPEEFNRKFADVAAHHSPLQTLHRIGARCDHRVRVEGDKLFFERPDYAKGAKYDYVWRDGNGMLVSFKPASKTEGKNKGPAAEATAKGVDKEAKKDVEKKASDETEKGRPVLAKGGLFTVEAVRGKENWTADTTGHVIVSHEPAKAEDHAKAAQAKGEASAVQATAEIFGDPTIAVGQIHRFINVGAKNSGPHRVVEFKTTISSQGFKTSMGLHRHGHSKSKTKSTGKVNETKPTEAVAKPVVTVRIVDGQEVRQ